MNGNKVSTYFWAYAYNGELTTKKLKIHQGHKNSPGAPESTKIDHARNSRTKPFRREILRVNVCFFKRNSTVIPIWLETKDKSNICPPNAFAAPKPYGDPFERKYFLIWNDNQNANRTILD